MNILIAGDFSPYARLAKKIEEHLFSEVFPDDVRKIITSADFAFVNFESAIVGNGYKPIAKCGPNLGCNSIAVDAVKYAGFTGVTIANNHILDFGQEGLSNTMKHCRQHGLDVVGAGNTLQEAGKVLYLEKNGEKIAIINCCEHEFSIASDNSAGANPLNSIRQYYAINEARSKADYVLIIVHGGHEHFRLPSPRMQETYRFFIDAGADAVVNHHQHCYSGYEIYKERPIFYGLGNFCFDKPGFCNKSWNEGYMVELSFEQHHVGYNLIPYVQCDMTPSVELIKEHTCFNTALSELNSIIRNPQDLKNAVDEYYSSSSASVLSMYQPYDCRILNKLYRLHLLPSVISKTKYLKLFNYIYCESHHDKQIFALKSLLDKLWA